MNKTLAYIIAVIGLVIFALGIKPVNSELASLIPGISDIPSYIFLGVGIVVLLVVVMIMRKSRELGLFELCSGPEVCDQLGPKHPATGASPEQVVMEESHIDLSKLVTEGVEHAECVSIH